MIKKTADNLARGKKPPDRRPCDILDLRLRRNLKASESKRIEEALAARVHHNAERWLCFW